MLPFSKNWTDKMPTVELAVAVTETEPETVALMEGDVIDAETPVLVMASVTGIVCGEFEALGSDMVVVAV